MWRRSETMWLSPSSASKLLSLVACQPNDTVSSRWVCALHDCAALDTLHSHSRCGSYAVTPQQAALPLHHPRGTMQACHEWTQDMHTNSICASCAYSAAAAGLNGLAAACGE